MSFESEELLQRHGAAIRWIAREFRLPRDGIVTRDDLFHAGVREMLEAARGRYDRGRGPLFWTFAYPRVRGAMVDATAIAHVEDLGPDEGDGSDRVMPLDAPDAGEQVETIQRAHAIQAGMHTLKIDVVLEGDASGTLVAIAA